MIGTSADVDGGATLTADVCIIGAGAAGIAIACELDRAPFSVVLSDAGDARSKPNHHALSRGEVDPKSPHTAPHMYRRAGLGGTTSIWGGRCVPLDPIDFTARSYVPNSGWPISWEDLEPHYVAAHRYCETGAYSYTVREALSELAAPTIEGFHAPEIVVDRLERFSPPTNFGRAFRHALADSRNIRVLLNSTCLKLVESAGRISHLLVVGSGGRRFAVAARVVVIAAGGLESTRLLMVSDPSRRGGLGNESGKLGRHYMCHIENTLGHLQLTPPDRPHVIDFERSRDGVYVRRKFCISEQTQRQHRLLNSTFRLHHPLIADPKHRSAVLSAMYLAKDAILPEYRRKLATIELAERERLLRDPRFWLSHARNVMAHPGDLMRFGLNWTQKRIIARRKLPFVVIANNGGSYPLDYNAEQVPNPDSTIELGTQRDSFGRQCLRINWRLAEQDIDNVVRTYQIMQHAFARSGCARLEVDVSRLASLARLSTPIGGHHMGTIRMSDDPRSGVVDRNCKIHSLQDLYVASAATFPTCGHANPTLTIVALALRLSQHLKERLHGGIERFQYAS
jgi:choline dehydrogenase-like flavoprotein